MSRWSLNSFDFSRENLHERCSAGADIPTNVLITHLFSMRATISRKKLIDNKFEAQTVTGTTTGNSRFNALASGALNMPCRFGQSARSIESRCEATIFPTWLSMCVWRGSVNVCVCVCVGGGYDCVGPQNQSTKWINMLAHCLVDASRS